jgi:choline dehydrogenase
MAQTQAPREKDTTNAEFVEKVRVDQQKLTSGLSSITTLSSVDSGSCGSLVARPLAENPDISVLLLEAGST